MKALITITILTILALYLNAEMTDRTIARRNWDKDLKKTDDTYKGRLTGYVEPIGHLGTLKTCRMINYIFAQEKYYRNQQ